MSDISPLSGLPSAMQAKLRLLSLCFTPLGVVATLVAWWTTYRSPQQSMSGRLCLPIIALLLSLLWTLLALRRISERQLVALAITAPALFMTANAFELSYTGALYTMGDMANWPWSALMCILAFLVLGQRSAQVAAYSFIAAQTVIFLLGLRHFRPTPEILSAAVQYFAASLMCTACLSLYADLKQHFGLAQSLASTDTLTGLTNRRQMQQLLESAVESQQPFTILLLDIDHFKRVNDIHGHRTGDAVLQEVGARLRAYLSAHPTPARWGGEEFLLLLSTAHPDEIQALGERLMASIREHAFPSGLSLTISMGGAISQPGERPEDVIHRADKALYDAKQAGRDRFHFPPHTELQKAA
ncbi:GGDEF domain-containing protein [Armatimonas rosea]|uniref:Diguanylate cyclase (GGDEF)-like protein n=1 Tax=Armatimonas rosea TaxID=685828 RepID=A0A7W9W6D1_ARMRO|nr:GGDEF domain-containing protein [Armatimonas rosea]MBB6050041.1 diguanylate cyclase (GGDEF)-like protein [Armatimonas rosea]